MNVKSHLSQNEDDLWCHHARTSPNQVSLGRKFLLTQNKVIEISFIVCVSDKVGLTCSEVWRLVSLLFLPGEEVAHPGGLLASCQRCGAQQGAVSTYLMGYVEMGPIYTQKFSKGFGSPEVKALLGDNSQSTHDPFLRKSHLKIRKGN